MESLLKKEWYKDFYYSSPAAMLIIATDAPVYTMLDVNEAYLLTTNTRREDLLGKSVFGVFPGNPTDNVSKNIERTIFSFEEAIRTKRPHTMSNYRYDIPYPGSAAFEERYWTTSNTPVMDDKGDVIYLIHSPFNVTELHNTIGREQMALSALQLQREQLYATFMQAPVGIGIFKGEDYIVDLINPYMCEIYEKTVDELIGKPVFDVLLDVKGKGFEELLDNVRLTGTSYKGSKVEVELSRKGNREKVFLNFVYEPFRELDGNISGVIAVVTDITEQVKADIKTGETEERAREEQRKLITLVDNSVDLMSILSLEGSNTYINAAGRRLLGFENETQVASTPISQLHAPENFELVEKVVLPTVMSKGRWAGTMLVRHLTTGEIFPVHNNCIRIDDPVSGAPIAVGAVMRDLRPEIAAKRALADSEQLLRNITTAAPTALWMSDAEGGITYINQTWIEWTGISYDANLGSGWLDAILPKDKKRARDKFLDDLATRSMYEVEFRINHKDGSVRWCIANGQPHYDTQGKFAGYIGACIDITEQKHLQQQKDDFIGIASHELKTPVTSIKGYTQVLEKVLRSKGDIKEAEMMGRMNLQINRLTSLIGDLLDVTKMNSGKLQFNDCEFDFDTMVKELVQDLQQATGEHRLVENYTSTGIVFGDKERIGQVITNLITNAIKYSPRSDKIIIHTTVHNNEVNLCVQDFGIGIPGDKLEKVFEQFYRVSGDMQHTFPGLGLGLYISAEIIKREGGRIWVTSREGEGSIFCFALPVLYKNN